MTAPQRARFDLVIRDGLVVSTGDGSTPSRPDTAGPTTTTIADVGISDGRIAAVARHLAGTGTVEIDASDQIVIPGGIDVHTHFANRVGDATTADDFHSGTLSAAFGGITTIVNYAIQRSGQPLAEALEQDRALAAQSSAIDYGFHLIVTDPSIDEFGRQMGDLVALGCPSVKIFTAVDDFRIGDEAILAVLRQASRHGVLVNVHAEDGAMIAALTEDLLASGRSGIQWLPSSRPSLVEEAAIRRVTAYAELYRTPLYFVHVSSAAGLRAIVDARSHGLTVYAETRPAYLFLDDSVYAAGDDRAKFAACWPPIRSTLDQQALWSGAADGTIDTYATDHTSWMATEKLRAGQNFGQVPGGFANVETSIGMLFSEGVGAGRLSLERFVDLTSTRPARVFGMWPRKGAIAVGSDADVVIIDPRANVTVDGSTLHSRSDVESYAGRSVTGWPRVTISHGKVIVADGSYLGEPGSGHFVARRGPSAVGV